MEKGLFCNRIRIYGVVQGVGCRPTVARHALVCGITGWVINHGPFVEILAEGHPDQMDHFLELLRKQPPKQAMILRMEVSEEDRRDAAAQERIFPDFQIRESSHRKGSIFISPDLGICEDCKRELYDPKDRRYLHPFINCTCCGPRLTITDALPYDRERTSMKVFAMCPECEREYHDPATRRYDAQPVCCGNCGPQVYLLPCNEKPVEKQGVIGREELAQNPQIVTDRTAISAVRKILSEGGIAAVKGIGGFHLCCDAFSEKAVQLLRTRKNRPAKPLAVMMRDMETVRRECEITPEQEEVLTGPQKPILLLKKKKDSRLAPSVAPGNPMVGVMLPYAPLQLLLFDLPQDPNVVSDCLVMTSGNPSGVPICRDDLGAASELGELSDVILSHNRRIRVRADDSVMDFYRGKPYMIRRSRGYAPLPFTVSGVPDGTGIAIGGELKNSFCIVKDGLFYLSPYIGDLEDLRSSEALRETLDRFGRMLEAEPGSIVCDLHPRYHSTEIAEELSEEEQLPLKKVQHHYAHILSCMAENNHMDPVIGISMDGTGYGTDGTIWGGEILLCDVHGFTRQGSIVPFLQLGGDQSAREGWRIALSMIYALTGDRQRTLELAETLGLCSRGQAAVLLAMADRKINAVTSTSAGRLFDAVSAILGIRRASTYEGEASCALEYAAEAYEENRRDAAPMAEIKTGQEDSAKEKTSAETVSAEKTITAADEVLEEQLLLPTDRLVQKILDARISGEDTGKLAWQFHEELARMITASCRVCRQKTGVDTVALSGGVWQNRLLLRLTQERLEAEGFTVLIHSLVPPNDGGLALGQALYGICNQKE